MKRPEVDYFVVGLPGPQGSKNHIGSGRMVESSKKVKPWRKAVKERTERAMRELAWTTEHGSVAIVAEVTFWLPRPKGHPRTRRTVPIRYPDNDKLQRSTFDALTAAKALEDDARVTDVHARKRYVHPPQLRYEGEPDVTGASIRLYQLPEEDY